MLPALDAAHIKPYSLGGDHAIRNGLLLRSDVHKLLDKGYVTISSDHRFEVSRKVKEDFDNGRHYYSLHGNQIYLPANPKLQPGPEYLAWHNEEVFKR